MERTPSETTLTLEHLAEQVRELEHRVHVLEGHGYGMPLGNSVATDQPFSRAEAEAPAPPGLGLPSNLSAGLIPVLGKAILGIGGAYLLRAATESGRFPGSAAVAATVLYAALWLVGSATTKPGREMVRAVYAPTAALIFFPMLWETTVPFKLLAPAATAALLVAFVLLGSVLSWFRKQVLVVLVTALPAAATALALMIGTGELVPFAMALVAICAIVEGGGLRERWDGLRPWVALIADLGLWLTIYVVSRPQQLENYRVVGREEAAALCYALLGIYAASVGFRTAWRRWGISVFETAQMAAAFALGIGGVLRLTHDTVALGTLCLTGAAVLYGVAVVRLERAGFRRNHNVYASAGLALVLAGTAMLLPAPAAAMLWSGLGLAALVASVRTTHAILAMHGVLCLIGGAFLSGLLDYSRLAMTAAEPPAAPPIVLAVVAGAALLSYLASSRSPERTWIRLGAAGIATVAAMAFLVALIEQTLGASQNIAWLPTVRTVVVSIVALLLGAASKGFERKPASDAGGNEASPTPSRRIELLWIGYAAMALVTLKIFVEDFHESPPVALAVSLLCYGSVLIFGPRLRRSKAREAQKQEVREQLAKGADAGS